MRIVAGRLGGRIFDSPGTHRTHPMSDRMRGALFNTLGDISDLTVLDAYSGTGALSFEAISRGAKHATAIDIDKDAYKTIFENTEKLGLRDEVMVLRKNISGWSRNHQQTTFDIVLADPPYTDVRPDVLERLIVHVKPGGIFALSWPGSEPVRAMKNAEIISHKSYGDAQLVFYRKIA
jgi:16S rRNA (guanine966-N2)-methyltransferase